MKNCQFFTDNNSTVNLCSLDLAWAFDKLNRFILYEKLIAWDCPIQFVNVLESWLSKINTVVKYNGFISEPKLLLSGLRHGSIMSTILFSAYMNDLLVKLGNLNVGCYIKNCSFNVLMYADDVLLLALSMRDLHLLMNIIMPKGVNFVRHENKF